MELQNPITRGWVLIGHPMCPSVYINTTTRADQLNCEFQEGDVSSLLVTERHTLVRVVMTCDVEQGAELFLNYRRPSNIEEKEHEEESESGRSSGSGAGSSSSDDEDEKGSDESEGTRSNKDPPLSKKRQLAAVKEGSQEPAEGDPQPRSKKRRLAAIRQSLKKVQVKVDQITSSPSFTTRGTLSARESQKKGSRRKLSQSIWRRLMSLSVP